MTAPVFVDANVFIYVHDAQDPLKQARAAEWITRLWHGTLGRTSIQVLSELYVTLTRKLSARVPAEQAWEEVHALLAWRPQPIDEALVLRARDIEQRHKLSWWDAMVVAAAQLQDCAVLLTEDLHDGAVFGSVTVRSPFTSVMEEAPGSYELARAPAWHRPRGRPKRVPSRP